MTVVDNLKKLNLYLLSFIRFLLLVFFFTQLDKLFYNIRIYNGIIKTTSLNYRVNWFDMIMTNLTILIIFTIISIHILSLIYSEINFSLSMGLAVMFKYSINTLIILIGIIILRENSTIYNIIVVLFVIASLTTFNLWYRDLYKLVGDSDMLFFSLTYLNSTNRMKKWKIFKIDKQSLKYIILNIIFVGIPHTYTFIQTHNKLKNTK